MSRSEIIEQLIEIKSQSLALYSNFHVAAILETVDKEYVQGFNIECSSYGLTICAERVAIFKALSDGKRNFKNIYIMSDGTKPCPPCGACRQVLMDYAPDLQVFMISENGIIKEMPLKKLLPYAFKDYNMDM